jgi:hypothetical protein
VCVILRSGRTEGDVPFRFGCGQARQDAIGKTYEVALEDVEFLADSKATPYIAAHRQWLGISAPKKSRRAEYREKN